MEAYRQQLRARLNPTVAVMSMAYESARAAPKRVLFAEGEEPNVLRAAIAFREGGYGTPVLVGREDVYDLLAELGVENPREWAGRGGRGAPRGGRAGGGGGGGRRRRGRRRRGGGRGGN